MKYKMIIFDLDGTLLNTLEDLRSACNYALSSFHLDEISLEQAQVYIGNGIKNLMLQASNYSPLIDHLLQKFKEYYKEYYNDRTKSYDGVHEMLSYCKATGMKIGVFTNKVEDIAVPLIQSHFPNQMDFIYGEVKDRPRKPDPTFINEILERYCLSKEEVLYVGDSEVDIQLCENAKLDGVFVSYGFREKSRLMELSKYIVDDPLEIIKYLGVC